VSQVDALISVIRYIVEDIAYRYRDRPRILRKVKRALEQACKRLDVTIERGGERK
jgi:hypothetical protein